MEESNEADFVIDLSSMLEIMLRYGRQAYHLKLRPRRHVDQYTWSPFPSTTLKVLTDFGLLR